MRHAAIVNLIAVNVVGMAVFGEEYARAIYDIYAGSLSVF